MDYLIKIDFFDYNNKFSYVVIDKIINKFFHEINEVYNYFIECNDYNIIYIKDYFSRLDNIKFNYLCSNINKKEHFCIYYHTFNMVDLYPIKIIKYLLHQIFTDNYFEFPKGILFKFKITHKKL